MLRFDISRLRHRSRLAFLGALYLAVSLAVSPVIAQTPATLGPLLNAGFEEAGGTSAAAFWIELQHAGPPSYRVTRDEKIKKVGKASIMIEQILEQEYGSVVQRIDARPAVGKRVKFAGWIRTERIKGGWGAGLYIRINGPGSTILAVDTSSARTKTDHDWKLVSLVIDVPANAVELEVGVTLESDGAVWADDLALRLTTDSVTAAERTEAKPTITFDRPPNPIADPLPRRRKVTP